MKFRPNTPNESRALLINEDAEQGRQLVEQLNHAGFRTDLTVSWSAARAALGANYFHSCIVVADFDQAANLAHLQDLRRAALRVWIIVLSDLQSENALTLAHLQDIDAVLSTPLSMHDLTSRLATYSERARPAL